MTLLSGFALLLSRYSGQQDLLVGTPVANRSGGEIENVVGCFVNTLVLRADLSGDPSVRQFLARLREVCLDDFEHQDLPFDRLVEELRPARDLSRNPLFQVMFALQNTPTGPLELPGLTLRPVDVARGAAHVDLSLHVQETVEGLSGIFEYATDLFEESTIARMAAHWRALLEAMTATPERCVWDLPLLTDGDRRQLLVEWNETKGDYPAGELMHELFEAQAARTPEAIAVVHEQRELSYGELNARANQLAHYLRGVGVKPDARVAICVERGIEMVVGLFAVLKAGGAYVPLDPAYPTERLTYMLQDSAPVAILTNAQVPSAVRAELRSALAGSGDAIPVIDLQAGAESWATQPASNPQRAGLKAGHLAYVIYTSGSTGRPKGVMIEHRNAVNFLYWAQASFSPAQLAHTLFSTSLNFDLAMYECFAPLVVGATTRVVRNALELAQAPHPVTLINTVPSTINALLDAGGVPETVRTVNLAGEPLKRALVERLFAQTQVDTVCNLYGPSETTTYSTWVAMRRADGFAAHIGRPIANTRIYLLDAHGQPVPVGAVGEIYIGGAGVARGYLNREELTAERFLPDPFAAEPDARMYRTGDLARYLTHGNIEFLGRNDFQVKIRGFRIELGEIETSIASHPAVRETVVIAREDMPGDQRLVAYVVPRNGEITAADLKQHLSSRLPSYMVPSDFVMLETLPRTPNAKIDRKALPAPGRSGSEATYTAPRNATEEAVAASWRKALQLQRVGIHDNFFEVGGHSLSFVRMISEINRSFKTRLGMVELIQNPTVEQLAKLIDAWHSQPSQLSRVVLLQEGRSELPVYFIYAGPGELRVAQHMAGSHPVFGVEARWPMAWRKAVSDNQTSAFPSLEQMVAPYVTELSAHARSTPCVLAGFCYAGRIAFEAAHQLRKLGGKVEFVILIDTDARPPNRYKLAWQIIRQDWKQSPSSVSTGAFQSLGSRVKNTWHTTWWLLGKVKTKLRSYFKRPKLDLGTLSGVLDEQGMPLPWGLLQRLYDEMEKTYVFRSLASRGVLFRTDEWDGKQIGHAPHDALGWETLFTEGVEIIPVAGHHFSIWGKQVPAIAHEINRVLAHRSSGQAHEAAVHDRKPLGVSPAPETGIGA